MTDEIRVLKVPEGEAQATKVQPLLVLNKVVMQLGYGVTLATNSFASVMPAWVVGDQAIDKLNLPEGVPPPQSWVSDESGMMYPCWHTAEVISDFLASLSQGTRTW